MSEVDADLNEYIKQVFYCHLRDRDEAAVAVVDDEVTAQFFRSEVVDAAGAIGNIPMNQAGYRNRAFHARLRAEGCDQVSDQSRVKQQSFRELQRDFVSRSAGVRLYELMLCLQHLEHGLGDLVVVILWQDGLRFQKPVNIDVRVSLPQLGFELVDHDFWRLTLHCLHLHYK